MISIYEQEIYLKNNYNLLFNKYIFLKLINY